MSEWWSKNRQRLIQLAGTILAAGLIVVLVKEEGWHDILTAFHTIHKINLLWATMLFLLARLAAVGRWHVLLHFAGIKMRVKDSLALTFTSLFASNFLPTTVGGDLVRLAGAMQMGFDRAICLASIAADRLIGMLSMSMMAPVGLWYSWSALQGQAIGGLVAFLQRPVKFVKRTLSVFGIWLKRPISLLSSLGFAWFNILCQFAAIYIFTKDLGSHASFWMVAGLWSLTYFITLIPISINGYGVQELSFTFLLTRVAGLTPAASLSVAVLIRAFLIFTSLPGALFLPSILAAMAEQKKNPASFDSFL